MAEMYEKAYKDRQKGLSYKEIAAKYGVSINTVKSWSRRHWVHIKETEAAKVHTSAHKRKSPEYTQEELKRRIEQGKNNIAKAQDMAKNDSEAIKAAREIVEYKKTHRPPAFGVKDIKTMLQRIGRYFNICDDQERPYTKAGLIRALDVSKSTYYRYLNGELDYLIEEHIAINHIDVEACDIITTDDGAEIKVDCEGNLLINFSSILQKAVLRLEEQAEERLYKSGRPGDIFTLKQFGWTDEKSPNTVNQTLVIASQDEADRALKMLYGNG